MASTALLPEDGQQAAEGAEEGAACKVYCAGLTHRFFLPRRLDMSLSRIQELCKAACGLESDTKVKLALLDADGDKFLL